MRQFISAVLIAVMLSTTGCSTWWQNFKKDPTAQVQSIISTLETVITIATVIFGEAKPLIPEAKREDAQKRFAHAVLAVEASKRTLRDALSTAEAARQDPPDLGLAIQGALKAAEELRSLVREVQAMIKPATAPVGSGVAPATSASVRPAMLPTLMASSSSPDDLDAAVEAVRRFQTVK